jgi:hypothetical protein
MFVQAGFLFMMWFLADEATVVHSCLQTSIITAFCLHLATISEIAQNDFSYYHTSIAIHLILLTIIPFFCALQYPGWTAIGLGEKISCIINALTLIPEFLHLTHSASGARQLARSCVNFTGNFVQFNTSFTGFVLTAIFVIFLPKDLSDTESRSANIAFTVFVAMWVTVMSAVFQSNVAARYQQYTDGSEAKFGFGQIFCMAAIAKPVYDLYQYGRDGSQSAEQTPRWRLWKTQCSSLINPFN